MKRGRRLHQTRIFRLKRKYRSLRTPSLDALMRNAGEMQRLYVHDAQRAWNDMVANAIALDLPEMKGKLGFYDPSLRVTWDGSFVWVETSRPRLTS